MSGTSTAATPRVDDLPALVEQLNDRIRTLENRVSTLEGHPAPKLTVATAVPSAPAAPRAETWAGFPSPQVPSGVPVIGRAVVGIAGAYLLRALAESGSVPKIPLLLLAVIYASAWMFMAARAHARSFASITCAITSALILAPMLWESTVRFQFLSPGFTGAILVAYFGLTLALSWRRQLQVLPAVAAVASSITALGLILVTHHLVPLTVTLLCLALVAEIAVCLKRPLTVRAVPAIAADLAVALLVYLMTAPGGVPDGYYFAAPSTVVSICLALAAIYLASIGFRAFWLRHQIFFLDVVQGVLTLLPITVYALLTPSSILRPALGVLFLMFAAACYWGALSRFTAESNSRNRRVSATWAAALVIVGGVFLFSPTIQVTFLCLASLLVTFTYTRTAKISLGLHASVFLAAASFISQLHTYALNGLAGTNPSPPTLGIWLTAISAAVCYAIATRAPADNNRRSALFVIPAAIVGLAAAGLAVSASLSLAAGRLDLTPSRLSVVRTIVVCALALALSYLAQSGKRVELSWLAYAAVGLGTVKLLVEDLRYGNAASLVVSLLFYGLILILLPRRTRRAQPG